MRDARREVPAADRAGRTTFRRPILLFRTHRVN
jgi:hypothetical protein